VIVALLSVAAHASVVMMMIAGKSRLNQLMLLPLAGDGSEIKVFYKSINTPSIF